MVRRHLSEASIPHLDASLLEAIATDAPARNPHQASQVAFADELIEELRQADTLVIGAPMYNFGIPSTLKAWFDHVARSGVSFKYTENGPVGLLGHKKVYVVTSRGGIHKGSPQDTQVSFLKTVLGFLGFNDVDIIYVEGVNMSQAKDTGLAAAHAQIAKLVPLQEEAIA